MLEGLRPVKGLSRLSEIGHIVFDASYASHAALDASRAIALNARREETMYDRVGVGGVYLGCDIATCDCNFV